jgi:hypothetical protein
MAMTAAERKAAQRAKGRVPGSALCTLCGILPRRPGRKTCVRCLGDRRLGIDTPHTCIAHGGLGRLDTQCERCREIAAFHASAAEEK